MKKLIVLLVGSASFVFAGATQVPEIDANTAVSAVALVSGGLMILRGRCKK